MRDYDLIPLGDSVFYGNVSNLVGMHVFAFSSLFLSCFSPSYIERVVSISVEIGKYGVCSLVFTL